MSFAPKPSGNVINTFTGALAIAHNKSTGYWSSMSIINDDTIDLIFTVNNLSITVLPNEAYCDDFEDFNQLSIDTNTSYRLVLRG